MASVKSGEKGVHPTVLKPRKDGRRPLHTTTVKTTTRNPLLPGTTFTETLQEIDKEQPFEIIYLFRHRQSRVMDVV